MSAYRKNVSEGVYWADYFATRCGLPVVDAFVVNQARYTFESLVSEREMERQHASVASVVVSGEYRNEVVGKEAASCDQFVFLTAYQN